MPAAHPRAALAAVAGPSSASCMAGLTARFGSLQVAGARSFSSSSSFSSFSSSSSSSSASSHISSASTSLPSQPARVARPPCSLTAASGRRPVLASAPASPAVGLAGQPQSASFSTTRPMLKSRNFRRTRMRLFFKKEGKALKQFDPEKPLYKQGGFTKYPYNPEFQTMSILSDQTRQVIWQRVVQQGEPVKAVAADLDVDMRRVAACVRLKELERAWILQGKPLAKAYAQAIESMLPTMTLDDEDGGGRRAFEPTNEIASHPYTQQQLFLPVSESRHFTRDDAAKAFHPTLLSADKRMPIPQLITAEKNALADGGRGYAHAAQVFREQVDKEQVALARREAQAVAAEEARTAKVDTDRFQFRIRDYNAEHVGKTGRSSHAVGWRYGTPYNDRKRGLLKIPSSIG